jgi:iron complex outermembrane receptor protein
MKKGIILALLLGGLSSFAQSQTLSISGKTIDSAGTPIEAATVGLLNASDSSLVKIELSDASGNFEFSAVKPGQFLVSVSSLGYEKYLGSPIQLNETNPKIQLPSLTLHGTSIELKAVTVTAKKPFIERRADRTIVNVESSILATGSTALDILERSPGVVVNQNDAISLRGRSGVIVMIDGKPNPMSGADLSNFLRTLPSNSIDRIELITNPSAKYDAAGNAGIIDIRLKKDKNLGTNGSFSANYGQGVYPKAGAGLTLNHRDKKVNVFGSYNYNFRKGMNDLRLYRTFYDNDVRTGAYDQRNYLTIPYNTHTTRAGADFFPNKKTVLGVVASGTLNHFNPRAQNTSAVEGQEAEVVSYFGTSNRSKDRWFSWAANANFKRSINEKGHELTADLDFAEYGNQTEQLFTTLYSGLNGDKILPDYLLFGDLQGNLKIRSLKADYALPLPGKAKLEAGVKIEHGGCRQRIAVF